MKTRFMIILLLFLLFAVFFAGCLNSQPQPQAPPENQPAKTEENKDRCLELATDNYPPFQYEENGELKGMTVDITREAFRRLGQQVSIKMYPWARALDMVKAGEADGIFLAFKTDERETYLTFPQEPLFLEIQSFFVKRESPIQYNGDMSTLRQYIIGTVKDYDFGPAFNSAINNNVVTIEPIPSNMQNIEKLMNNRIDILLDNNFVTMYNLKRSGLTDKVRLLNPAVRQDFSYLAFSKKRNIDKDLIARFEQVIKEMKQDGTYDSIMKQYIN